MSDWQVAFSAVDWNRAACVGAPPDLFFPDMRTVTFRKLEVARAICGSCPIRVACRDYGQRWELHGIWGGVAVDPRANDMLHRGMPWFRAGPRPVRKCKSCQTRIALGQKYRLDPRTGHAYCESCST